MWTDATCTLVSGVTQATGNYNPISCTSDCSSETCTNLISVTNFADTNVSDDIIIFIGAKSPLAAGATSPFEAYLYASETDTTAIIEKRTDLGSQTLAAQVYPYDFWIEWPTETIYHREIKADEYGEIYIRFRSRVTIPTATGVYKITIDSGFDIAQDATPKCTIYHKDMPFDNYPEYWDGDYHHTIIEQCYYHAADSEFELIFPSADILREFYGIT